MITSRFAPSPTGYLHLGHGYSAWMALQKSDRLLLRIEDIDRTRCRAQYVDGIREDLEWLGINYEPDIRFQSDRWDAYADALDRLRGYGVLYPCFCTRKEIAEEIARSPSAPHGPEGPLYPGICRQLSTDERTARLAAGMPHAWRLDVAKARILVGPLSWDDDKHGRQQARPDMLGDGVLARKDIATSYHLAVVVDDAAQDVDLVVRGEDLMSATHIHRLLQALLDLPVPRYCHHGLLTDDRGKRLAKRNGVPSLWDMRREGMQAQALITHFQVQAEAMGDLSQKS